jgi:hypothetical protein
MCHDALPHCFHQSVLRAPDVRLGIVLDKYALRRRHIEPFQGAIEYLLTATATMSAATRKNATARLL